MGFYLPLDGVGEWMTKEGRNEANENFSGTRAFDRNVTYSDALINNQLSLKTKSIMLDTDISEVRGEVWPIIFGVVAVDLALQAYFYGVYVPSTRRG